LMEMGAAEDEDSAAALCAVIQGRVRLARMDGGASNADANEPVLLQQTVIVKTNAKADDAKIAQLMNTTLDSGQQGGNVNSEIKVFDLGDCDTAELTERQLRDMIKNRKRDSKRFVKDTRLEKASAERRNALIEALKTRPVILHRDSSCINIPDINLNNVQMDLDGKVLLEDCTCAIVAGRRYGLVGKNGSGKTTFLRHLAAKKFEGVANIEELQIVHIEQEVEGDERSVLETVLACDFEREALLEEESDIQLLLKALDDPSNKTGYVLGGQSAREEGEALDTRLGEIYERLTDIEADSAPARASKILSGLQVNHADSLPQHALHYTVILVVPCVDF
jgi:ATP-binding cassette subfamily F protein 3